MSKTALITGVDTNAIARTICETLLQSDYDVIATLENGSETEEVTRQKFSDEHAQLSAVEIEIVDFVSKESVAALISRLARRSFDVVVNCAAVLAMKSGGSLLNESVEFDYSEFSRVLQYNVTAVAAICLGLKDHITRGGTIINVTSSAAEEGAFATISYNASKAALNSLTKSLANSLGPSRGIRVNSIAPGWIPPSGDVAADDVVALANALTPSLVPGRPENIATAVQYLIANPFQNGAIIPVDGGITSSYLVYMLESLQLQGMPMDETIRSLVSLISKGKSDLHSAD